jgi:predicted XRE-type DNA-binding protein
MDYKTHIKSRGIKQTWIADKVGVSRAMITMFLNGKANLSPEKRRILDSVLEIK